MITGTVTGAGSVVAHIADAGSKLPAAVRTTVQKLGMELLAKVKAQYLTGQALKVQSGRLRRSINVKMTGNAAFSEATVGTNVAYGRVWELGFSGDVTVRAHVRKSKKGAEAMVKAHQRRMNLAPRPFLKPALEEMRPRVLAQLTKTAAEAARGSQP